MTVVLVYLLIITGGCGTLKSPASTAESENSPLISIIRIYQGPLDHLSSVRYGECPMFPSCSEYAIHATRKHGALIGWIMACDRLMRCGRDEVDLSPEVLINGRWKTYDTVEANDWWWSGKDRETNNRRFQDLNPSPAWDISIQ